MPDPAQGVRMTDGIAEKANILIVDDLPEKLLVFQTILEELGQNLVMVHSGSEALKEVLEREFAVILLDVNMPDIDGIETASLIRRYKRSAHTPIIFITAYADEMQKTEGYSLGAVDYILSPVLPDVLRSKVKVFVELFQAQQRTRLLAEERVALARAEAARTAAEETTRRSNFLARASRELSASLDIEEGMRRLLELVVPQMAELGVAVMDTESEGRQMLLRITGGEAPCETSPLEALPHALLEPLQQVLLETQPVETNLAGLDESLPALQEGWPAGLQAALALPLRNGERTVGALLLGARRPFPAFSTRDLSMLTELGSRAAMALDNAALYRSLQRESARLKEAEERLQESNRRKDEFLAMLSHELRNPLAPIRTAVEVIRRLSPPDPNLVMARDVVDRQVNHLVRLVEELLDVSRISEGKVALRKESIELGAVIRQSLETVRPLIEARGQRLVLNVSAAPIWLFGDFARLAQVVGNLVNNAAKYTQEGGRIEVTASAVHGESVIEVRDNGSGIDLRLLPRIFELFVQGERALDRSQGGLGVGLTLVKRLVEMHQGRVEALSEGIGRGATFRVTLPCMNEVRHDEPLAARAELPAQKVGRRILVVDDNADAADSIAAYLRLEGHEVKSVNDGHAAVASCHVFAPQVVVLDIGLPGIDGYKVARRLRELEQTRDALLIALTGYGQKEDRARAAEAGFDCHFVKPCDPRELQRAIERDRRAAVGQQASSA